ncbi:MAG: acyl-CoA synthetase [Anaerolineaceae bacterium]|nr:acyl-CoA synthetase [Anaerolineaceae bacterium]
MSVLATLEKHIRAQPERLALRILADGAAPKITLTYGQLGETLAATGTYLSSFGLKAGDRLAFQLPKGLSFILLHWAALRLGAISLPLNPAYPAAELSHFLRDSDARFFFRSADMPPCPADLPALEKVFTIAVDGIEEAARSDATATPFGPLPLPEQPAVLIYTSGTTGRAKGALLSHLNLTANAAALHDAWGWQREDVLLHVLPLFHVHGLFVALQNAWYAGATVHLRRRFDAATTLADLNSGAYSVFMAVPTIHARLLQHPDSRHCDFRHLRLMTSGSDRLPDTVFQQFEARFGYRLLERYGMTETGMNLSNPLHGERRRGSVGLPLPGVEARIVDRQSGAILEDDQTPIGELQIRGAHVFRGYWQNPPATAAAFTADGWLRTGDLASRAADGYYTLHGRIGDLIISGGLNIYPAEVERVLTAHPNVAAAAVIGCSDERWGERPLAVVVLQKPQLEEAALTATLRQHCRSQLAPYKCPEQYRFLPELPRNSMGKIQKGPLRARFASG